MICPLIRSECRWVFIHLLSNIMTVVLPCAAEIEYNFSHYRNRFSMPTAVESPVNDRLWWSMDIGSVHFVRSVTFREWITQCRLSWGRNKFQRRVTANYSTIFEMPSSHSMIEKKKLCSCIELCANMHYAYCSVFLFFPLLLVWMLPCFSAMTPKFTLLAKI